MEEFDFVRFTFTDIHGISRCKTVTKDSIAKYTKDGVGFYEGIVGIGLNGDYHAVHDYISSEFGYAPIKNIQAIPVMETLHHLPTVGGTKHKVGQVLCETFHSDGRQQVELPRYVARRQINQLRELGFEVLSSYELEFVLVHPATLEPVFNGMGHFFRNLTMDDFDPVLLDIASHLKIMGVELETLQTEFSSGQFEIVLKPQLGIKSADNAILTKDTIKQLAKKHGYRAVFMTKLGGTDFDNGSHYNMSLCGPDSNKYPFSDPDSEDKVSDTLRHFLGGLARHYPACSAIFSPTVNCYRRLGRPPLTMMKPDWGIDERAATFRVKNIKPSSTYLEIRPPSGSSNPYLVMAASLAAGYDGIINKLPCPEKFVGTAEPVKSPPPTGGSPSNSGRTLNEAIEFLRKDSSMEQALGKGFVKMFTSVKEAEAKLLEGVDVRNDRAEWLAKERDMYLDMI